MINVIAVSHCVANIHSVSHNAGSVQCAECIVAIAQLRRLDAKVKRAQSPSMSLAEIYLYLKRSI
jgi:hypothetical protein